MQPIFTKYFRYPSIIIDCILLIIICIPIWLKIYNQYPINTDLIVYTACVYYIQDKGDVQKMHADTYSELAAYYPEKEYELILGSPKSNKQKLHENAIELYKSLPLGVIKPLYILCLWLLHLFKISVVLGSKIINSFAIIGILSILYKAFTFWPKWARFILLFAGINLSPLQDIFCLAIPDPLAALIGLIGFYYILIHFQLKHSNLWFCLTILIRPELIILTSLLMALLLFLKKISKQQFSYSMLCMLLTYFMVSLLPNLLFNTSLNLYVLIANEFAQYFNSYVDFLIMRLKINYMLLIIIIFNIVVILFYKLQHITRGISLILIIFVMLRYLMQPFLENRFYLLPYLVSMILLYKIILSSKWDLFKKLHLSVN